jgi:hypothetical protein
MTVATRRCPDERHLVPWATNTAVTRASSRGRRGRVSLRGAGMRSPCGRPMRMQKIHELPEATQVGRHGGGGDPTNYITEKERGGQLQVIEGDVQSASAGERAAVAMWRERQAECSWGQAVLIVRDNQRRERLNAFIRAELTRDGRLGESIHIGGYEFAVGDRVVARRNDRERAVDNGMRGTVIAVDPNEKDVLVRTDAGSQRRLDASYVAEHLQHAYALTAHTIQGATVEWAGVVGRPEDFTRNWSYTALSRAREATELFVIDAPTERELDRAEIAPDQPAELGHQRTPIERLEAAMRQRDDEDLALDRIDSAGARVDRDVAEVDLPTVLDVSRRSVEELRTELAQLRERIGHYPDHLADQLHTAQSACAEAQHVADQARARIAELEQSASGLLRRQRAEPTALALERERLNLAEQQATVAAERIRKLALEVPDRGAWDAERRQLRKRAAELDMQLSMRRHEHLRDALQHPSPYLLSAIGAPPDQPRARRTWQQAAQRIEAHRFDHAITDSHDALGPEPAASPARERWQRAQHEVQRAQRELARQVNHVIGREL